MGSHWATILSLSRCAVLVLVILALPCIAIVSADGSAREEARVRWVNDGDTVVLADGRRLRYIGIDTPEIAHDGQPAEALGEEARRFNKSLVAGGTVHLELDQERQDHYGRLLAYVFLPDGTLVNARLIEAGLAFCLPSFPNLRYRERLLQAQRHAMQTGVGMWRDWHEPAGDSYVGNRRSGRFHRAGCQGAQRIHPHRRIRFPNRWDAFLAGFAPSRDCLEIR